MESKSFEVTPNNLEQRKIGSLDQIKARVKELKEQGKSIVYIEGVFDVCHLGHKRLIDFASEQGDVVVIGVASNEYAATKGPGKPAFDQNDRCEFLSAFEKAGLILKLENPADKPDSDEGSKYLTMVTDEIKPDIIVASTTTDTNPDAKKLRAESAGAKFVPFDAPRPTPHSTSTLIKRALELLG
jgi:cytidyltransferase-like protein